MNRTRKFSALARIALILLLAGVSAFAVAKTDDETRAKIREQSKEALARLYQASPSAKGAIERSAGYATFSNWGLKLGIAGGGQGKGLAVTRPAGKETFMRFVEVQAGLGIGIKKFDLIFVFENQQSLNDFINKGWEYSGQATAAAKSGDKGKAYNGAVSVSPGVWLYQLTEKGLAAELTVKGSKYYKDKSLN